MTNASKHNCVWILMDGLPRHYSCVRQATENGCAGPRERGLLAESEPIRMVEAVRKTTNKGDQHMKKTLRFVGLDVHKNEVARFRVGTVNPKDQSLTLSDCSPYLLCLCIIPLCLHI